MDGDDSTAAAARVARALLRDADGEAAVIRQRAGALAEVTAWRSRATDAYRAGLGRLVDDLTRLGRLIDQADGELAAVEFAVRFAPRGTSEAAALRWQ